MKIKVLMVGPARSVQGGVSAVVNNYYKTGLDQKVDLTYLGTMEDGSKFHKLLVAVKALLRYLIIVHQYDIIHIHMASDVSLYRKIPFIYFASLRKKKIIIHQHGGNIEEFYKNQCSFRKQRFILNILNRAEVVLAIAPALKDFFMDLVGKDKVILMQNSILLPRKAKKDYTSGRLLFLGRLCKEKGIRELVEAAFFLKEKFQDLELYLCGTFEEESLTKLVAGQEKWIHTPGWIMGKEKEEILEKCNIFVLPSYFEGQPISLLEAMAHGCACIATRVGGIPEMIQEGCNGKLIAPRSKSELQNAILEYLEDPVLQEQYGEAAYQKILCDYNLEKNLNHLLEIYQSME